MTVEAQKGVDTQMFLPQLVTDGNTISARIDTVGASHCTIRVNLGVEQTGSATATVLSLLESDDTVVTNFATITADLAPDCETAHIVRYEVACGAGRKRYLRLTWRASTTGGAGDINIGAIATLFRNAEAPATLASLTTTSSGTDVVVV